MLKDLFTDVKSDTYLYYGIFCIFVIIYSLLISGNIRIVYD